MVEEFGEVPSFSGLGNTYVFAETWPSWAFAVDGLGLENVTTCVKWSTATAREEFQATSLGSTLVSQLTAQARVSLERESNLKPPLLFIQGSPSYVRSVLSLFAGIACHSICAMVGSVHGSVPRSAVSDISSLHWREVSHKALAGITTGSWLFGTSLHLGRFHGLGRTSIRRTFSDVASHTTNGVRFDSLPPPRKYHLGSPIFHMEDRVPFGRHNFTVAVPSVYLPDRSLVVRLVTHCKLMSIYDIECATQRELTDFWHREDVLVSYAFTQQAPVKVLYSGARQALAAALHLQSSGSPPPSSDDSNDGIRVPDVTLQSELDGSAGTAHGDVSGSARGAAPGSDVSSATSSSSPGGAGAFARRLDGDASGSSGPLGDASPCPAAAAAVCHGIGLGVGDGVGVSVGANDGRRVSDVGSDVALGTAVGDCVGVGVDGVVGDGVVGVVTNGVDGVVDGSSLGDGVGSPSLLDGGHGSAQGAVDGVDVSPPTPSSSFGMESDPSQMSEADVKAAKNDDAEVNVDEWNSWTLSSYVPPTPADRPLICIPGPVTDLHRHSFNIIRKGLLYAWKRRLLRGFRKHLNVEHDKGRRVPFHTSYRVLNPHVDRGGGKWVSISVTAHVSPWCLSPLSKRPPRKRNRSKGTNDELYRDISRGVDCLERAGHSTFWEWVDGSSIFFWRWPKIYKKALRDGAKLWICGKLPEWRRPQRVPSDPATREKLLAKLQVPRSKRYITPGYVISRTGYFDVPKGNNDIRIVYDATACGLNRALWSPNFYLPTIDALLRNADANTYYGDIDLGEMFLNYALDETLRPYAGVDVSALDPARIRGEMKMVIERWERTLMGLRPSPFVCTQAFSWSEEIIRGNRLGKDNPLRWDKVVLNLPGDPTYDPSRPWVYKWNSLTNDLAGSFGTYVDDVRTQNQSEASCRATTRRVASGVGYLGQQDAPRKRRPPVKRPGAWSGAMCFSVEDEGLYVTCSTEKWNKGKRLVKELFDEVVVNGATHLDRSKMEKSVGFLVHLSRTFPALFPYFKGIYLTMESWREGRDDEGWKFSRKGWWNLMAGALDDEDDNEDLDSKSFEERKKEYLAKNQGPRPKLVSVVKRLSKDLTALMRLFDHELPPKRLVRGKKLQEATYGFGDASGSGFGSSWGHKGPMKYRVGTWGSDMDASSSNHRELRNLVDSLRAMEEEGTLRGTEAFIFTDNSTAEAAFYKGTSASPLLFKLVLELRELEMRACCKVHLIHVAGTRMIAQGADGLSRGNFTEGAMKGKNILDFIPIKDSALDRSPALKEWIKGWTSDEVEFLNPEGWFDRGHDLTPDGDRNVEGHWIPSYKSGCFVWSPPPAAAEVAVEELRRARHKRQESHHIFVVPRLMKPSWFRHLCHGSLSGHQSCWSWEGSCIGCGKMTSFPKDLFCGNFGVCRGNSVTCRRSWHARCYKACQRIGFRVALPENDEGIKWKKKKDENRFMIARGGDCLSTPFQCDFCWFENLEHRQPLRDGYSDQRLMSFIRRVNLDMMWSREPSTVSNILGNIRKGKRMSDALNLEPIDLPMGPWPIGDYQGFQVAIEMLRASLLPGRNDDSGQQYDTIRKLRSAYSNVFEAGPRGAMRGLSFKGAHGSMVHFTSSSLNSVLFRQFIYGMEKRMGRLVLQNIALSPQMMILLLDSIESELKDGNTSWERKRHLILCGGAFVVLYAGGLRGEEILMAEGWELCRRIDDGKFHPEVSHVYVPLMGRFKHETGERNILLALASVTEGSGIEVRKWVERWVAVLKRENKQGTMGPALCDVNGFSYPRGSLNHELHIQLTRMQRVRPDLIDQGVDIAERFGIHRSFRRGATTRALSMDVPLHVVEMNNRWRKSQQRSGGLPNLPMAVLYTQIQQSLLTRLQFSRSL